MGRRKKGSTESQDKAVISRIEKACRPTAGTFTSDLTKLEKTGENQRIISAIIKEREIANSADLNDIDSLYDCLKMYLQHCMEDNIKVTNAGAYAACGLSKNLVHDWCAGRTRADDTRYKEFATTLKNVCSEYREIAMASGSVNPIVGIWWQKVYEGYRDNEDVREENYDMLGDSGNASEISDKYDDMPD